MVSGMANRAFSRRRALCVSVQDLEAIHLIEVCLGLISIFSVKVSPFYMDKQHAILTSNELCRQSEHLRSTCCIPGIAVASG